MGYLSIVGPSVVHETIEGEVVIVDLDKGLYFSTDGVGAYVWSMIVAGRSIDEMRAWGADAFGSADGVQADVDEFLASLRDHGLVAETSEASPTGSLDGVTAPSAYTKPVLNIYSDMAELLLLDPIHEVADDAGWPHAAV